jgi:hypothetical protein
MNANGLFHGFDSEFVEHPIELGLLSSRKQRALLGSKLITTGVSNLPRD